MDDEVVSDAQQDAFADWGCAVRNYVIDSSFYSDTSYQGEGKWTHGALNSRL